MKIKSCTSIMKPKVDFDDVELKVEVCLTPMRGGRRQKTCSRPSGRRLRQPATTHYHPHTLRRPRNHHSARPSHHPHTPLDLWVELLWSITDGMMRSSGAGGLDLCRASGTDRLCRIRDPNTLSCVACGAAAAARSRDDI